MENHKNGFRAIRTIKTQVVEVNMYVVDQSQNQMQAIDKSL